MAASDESTSQETGFKLKPTPVPQALAQEAKEKMERGLQKQRQLLANVIFPSNMPGPCHPNVTSFVHLIRDLEIAAKGEEKSGDGNFGRTVDTPFSKDDLQRLKSNSTNGSITPLKEIEVVQSKCNVHLRRAEHYQNIADKRKEEGADKHSLFQVLSMAKIFQMNYQYCIAAVSCPQRVATFNHCFSKYTPDVIKAVVEAGQHKHLCGKERKAIERCCGQKVQSAMRKVLE
jgi:hypothetical protein